MNPGGTFIIIPTYNESQSIVRLLEEINSVTKNSSVPVTIVVVDDGSGDNTVSQIKDLQLSSASLRIISLLYNIGHQSAIAQGILFAHSQNATHAIIMDGDGEDDPNVIPKIFAMKEYDIVNVTRGKRSESFAFRISYSIYRFLFYMITNKKMNFGNYCMINSKVIEILSVRTFIHFPAFLSKLQLKTTSIPADRRKRLGGNTKMSATNLVHHAFRSFAEYGEALLMVFLRLFIILFILFVITIGYIVYLKVFTDYQILGWSSTFGIGLLTSALICVGFFVLGVLQLNHTNRNNFPPVALYKVVR